jgi:Fur family transcriptional regulator, iron response regulator
VARSVSDVAGILKDRGIQPSAQRMAIAAYILGTDSHPSADQVFAAVKPHIPVVSRATVYNTLNLLVSKGLLRELVLAPGKIVFDPHLEAHHHFIDESTGRIHDVPWDAVRVAHIDKLPGMDVREYQVVMRGRTRVE